jgi:hypothetical protein
MTYPPVSAGGFWCWPTKIDAPRGGLAPIHTAIIHPASYSIIRATYRDTEGIDTRHTQATFVNHDAIHLPSSYGLAIKKALAKPVGVTDRSAARLAVGGRRCIRLPSVGGTLASMPSTIGVGATKFPHSRVFFV